MKIKYSKDEKKGTIFARATPSEKDYGYGYAEGLDFFIAGSLVERGFVDHKKIDAIPVLVSAAAPHGDDVEGATDERGREVARDKVLVKYFTRLDGAIDAYLEGLDKERERIEKLKEFVSHRIENAEERLAKY